MAAGAGGIELVRKSTSHKVVLSYDPNVEEKTDMNIRGEKFPGRNTSRAKALRQKRAGGAPKAGRGWGCHHPRGLSYVAFVPQGT